MGLASISISLVCDICSGPISNEEKHGRYQGDIKENDSPVLLDTHIRGLLPKALFMIEKVKAPAVLNMIA